jgi:hypothetical protein
MPTVAQKTKLEKAAPDLLAALEDAVAGAERAIRFAEAWVNQGQNASMASISTEGTLAEMYASMAFVGKARKAIKKAT